MKKLFTFFILTFGIVSGIFAQTKNLAVATFDILNNAVTKEDADAITELYMTALVATSKVNVVDRMNFDKILKEMNFQNSDWSNKEKTAELGKATNADLISRGQIIKLGSKMYLSTTIIDIKNANTLSSAKQEFNSLDDIVEFLPKFAKDAISGLFLKIGDIGPGGGIIFYIEGTQYLECSNLLGEANWKDAIELCKNYRGGGYDDWYLPNRNELNYIYENLRKTKKIGEAACYWSSSDDNNDKKAWHQSFYTGERYFDINNTYNKDDKLLVRAVRAFNN